MADRIEAPQSAEATALLEIPHFLRKDSDRSSSSPRGIDPRNPKTLTGTRKVPMMSVVPMTALIHAAEAFRYGAFEAPRVDGKKGYGPFNWREQPIESSIYVDAAMRHLSAWQDGTELDPDSSVHELGHAIATIAIILDAIAYGTLIDQRPNVRRGVVRQMLIDKTRKS
jgi:hypothetical protein